MKQENVRIGMVYETRIGGELARVVIVAARTGTASRDRWGVVRKDRLTFEVRRIDGESLLPKARTAAALREV